MEHLVDFSCFLFSSCKYKMNTFKWKKKKRNTKMLSIFLWYIQKLCWDSWMWCNTWEQEVTVPFCSVRMPVASATIQIGAAFLRNWGKWQGDTVALDIPLCSSKCKLWVFTSNLCRFSRGPWTLSLPLPPFIYLALYLQAAEAHIFNNQFKCPKENIEICAKESFLGFPFVLVFLRRRFF